MQYKKTKTNPEASSIKSVRSIESIAVALNQAESWEGSKVKLIDRVDR